jgi:hypothetical protein
MTANLGRWAVAAACLGATALFGTPVRAEEEAAAPARALELRWLSVGALTHPVPGFVPDRGPRPATADDVNSSASPMFGGEAEEGIAPYGTVDEVIEAIKGRTPRAMWDGEGTSIAASGRGRILVRASRAALDAVSAALADLEREAVAFVTMDLLALEGDGAAAAGAGGLEGALRSGAMRIVGAARASAMPGQSVAVLSGGERAYLIDHDVEVAEEATSSDPIVGVLNLGLCASLRPSWAGEDLRVDVHAWTAALEGMSARETAEMDAVEVPRVLARETRSPMQKVVPGAWTYLSASRDFGFALRATLRPATSSPGGVTMPSAPRSRVGALESASIDVSDLAAFNVQTRASRLYVTTSNYTPPENPELAEPVALFPLDAVVETVKSTVDPESWETEGTSLEVRHRRLFVRTDAAHLAAVRTLVGSLRSAFVRSYRAKATLVSLPLAGFPELVTGIDDGTTLLSDGGAALLARSGARIEERASVRLLESGRTGVHQGTNHRYLGDYDVEIAKKAAIGNPRVFGVLEGVSLDVEANGFSNGSALALDLRFDRSTWGETRRVNTRHGPLELPSIGLHRVRGTYLVPLSATRLAGLWTEGDRAMLLLLTATAE